MKILGSLIFAIGIIIAISGGAKMPHVALTGPAFLGELESDKFTAETIHDLWVGDTAITFKDRDQADAENAIPYMVRLATNDERSEIVALLAQKAIAYSEVDPTASYATDPLAVPVFPSTWPLFATGAGIGLLGLVLWRMGTKAEAVAAGAETKEDVHDPVTLLHQMVEPVTTLEQECATLSHTEITTRVDAITEQFVLPFAEVRHVLLDRFGTAAGAEILVTMAYAERMLNRTWSAAADEHLEEARNSIPDVLAGLQEANRLVERQIANEHA